MLKSNIPLVTSPYNSVVACSLTVTLMFLYSHSMYMQKVPLKFILEDLEDTCSKLWFLSFQKPCITQ